MNNSMAAAYIVGRDEGASSCAAGPWHDASTSRPTCPCRYVIWYPDGILSDGVYTGEDDAWILGAMSPGPVLWAEIREPAE